MELQPKNLGVICVDNLDRKQERQYKIVTKTSLYLLESLTSVAYVPPMNNALWTAVDLL